MDGLVGFENSRGIFPIHRSVRFLLVTASTGGKTDVVPCRLGLRDAASLEMATRTLERMAAGGIHDQVGGGFHRYSVDEFWLVPHFEKMLYDNAQLAQLYLDAFLVSGEARHAEVARDILDYVLSDAHKIIASIRKGAERAASIIGGLRSFSHTRPVQHAPLSLARDWLEETRNYWQEWVRGLAIPFDWQEEVIRAAITLKLCTFEDTGAVLAALTTSIPEGPGSGRTWDYRYCWMRDAFFVVRALNRIGATRTMEEFISYIVSIAVGRDGRIKPLYGIVHTDTLEERTAEALAGFNGDGPVRIGNAAVHQSQHDVYGSIIMAATPMFFDRRLPNPGNEALFKVIEPLGHEAARLALEPDAGIWEYRGRQRVHTHSAAMCWAGCQRLAAIATRIGLRK